MARKASDVAPGEGSADLSGRADYCRVSTVGQRDEGVSLEMQRERIAGWCQHNGYEQGEVFVEVMSGGRAANRPELLKAISLACKVRGILVVYSLSRLARSVKDTLLIAERLEKSGANLASLSERIDILRHRW